MDILLIEDDEIFRKSLEYELMFLKYSIDSCSNVDQAISLLKSNEYTHILLDYDLGINTGFEIVDFINKNSIISSTTFMTSYATKEIAIEALNKGVHSFIEKPFEIDVLVNEHLKNENIIDLNEDISFIPKKKLFKLNDEEIYLTEIETKLLEYIFLHPNQAVSSDDLKSYVWGKQAVVSNIISTHLSNIRKKIPEIKAFISSSRHKGYYYQK